MSRKILSSTIEMEGFNTEKKKQVKWYKKTEIVKNQAKERMKINQQLYFFTIFQN